MRLSLWPQSLFWRLLAASVGAVLLAHAVALLLIAQERERFVLQGSVREWTRHITETTLMLQPLGPDERAAAVREFAGMPHLSPPGHRGEGHSMGRGFVRLPLLSDLEQALRVQLRAALGPAF